ADAADVVVSNCVMNLVPNKQRAFEETFRILKKGGHFSISDIVLVGDLPKALQESAEMYAGCVSGAIQKDEYLNIIKEAGFTNIKLQKEKKIELPKEIVSDYLSKEELENYHKGNLGIYSITVYAEKQEKEACCEPGCCN
ncbi:MAG TPA: methyltransferase domain-containing protein, partial [Cyclobacteriaceae bacterium]|nr:methyltransferase domain-containing protein [Cyclobacteriaceae bacterium]